MKYGKRKRKSQRFALPRWLRTFGTLIGFLVMVGIFWLQRPSTFLTARNLLNITQQVSILGVIAFAMTVVMAVGDFDLSVGTMASLVGIVVASAFQAERPIEQAVVLGLFTGLIGGLLNGTLVSYIGISPFVATLSTMTIFGGLALLLSDGSTIFGRIIPEAFVTFGNDGIALGLVGEVAIDLPYLTLVTFGVLTMIWVVMEQTVFGRRLYMLGGNMEAARFSGLRIRFLRMMAFVVSGLGAAIGGIMLTSRLGSANPKQGDGLMLTAIAAVFLGMTTSEEGEPHVLGTFLGVLFLGVMVNGLTQIGIDAYIQQVLTGVIILLAVALSSLSKRT